MSHLDYTTRVQKSQAKYIKCYYLAMFVFWLGFCQALPILISQQPGTVEISLVPLFLLVTGTALLVHAKWGKRN